MKSLKTFINKSLILFSFNINPKVKKIMKIGISLNFVLVLIATLIFSIYISSNQSYILYLLGSLFFKASTMFIAIFFIFGICFNKLLTEKNIF